MNLTTRVAIIGAVAVILAAIVGGIFGLIPYLMQISQSVTVQGIVTDETDMPVARAKVSIDSQSDMTSNDGRYVISDVPTGTKIIRVEYMSKEVYKSTITIEGKQKTRTFDISISLKPPIPTTTSTGKISISIDQMHGGSISLSPHGYVTHSNETKFELQIGGVLYHYNCARFSLVSSGNGLYAVDRL